MRANLPAEGENGMTIEEKLNARSLTNTYPEHYGKIIPYDDLIKIKDALEIFQQQVSVEPVVSVNFEEETYKIIIAGNKLAEAAHKVQSDYDGIHRLRLALAEWYRTRANEFNRDNKISD